MKTGQMRARIEALEQSLDLERAAYEDLSRDYDRLAVEAAHLRAEVARLRAEATQQRPIPRRPVAA